jgi:signal peptidase
MKWLKLLKNILTVTVFLLVLTLGILIYLSGKTDLNGWRLLIVKSGSMEPTIKTGSLIFVKKEDSYQKGDVVTFGPVTRPELLITHRIEEVIDQEDRKFIKTKGDFNATADIDLSPMSSVVAKYHFGIPYIGYVIGFAQTQIGVVLLIIIPGTILIYDELMNLKKAIVTLYQKSTKKKSTEEEKPTE